MITLRQLAKAYRRPYFWWLLAGIGLLIFIGCSQLQQQIADSAATERQTLRIGYAIEPPYAYLDEQQRVTGESPETARQIAALLGISELQWVQLPFAELIPALQNRQIDMIASGLFINRDRQQRVRFTLPTLKVYPGLLVAADKQADFSSDFQENLSAERRFVVIDGSVEAAKLSQLKQPVDKLTVSDLPAALAALKQDDGDTLLLSLPTLRNVAKQHTGFAVIELDTDAAQRLPADYVAFAFHRNDNNLFTAWNHELLAWLGSESHLQTVAPFGFSRQDIHSAYPR